MITPSEKLVGVFERMALQLGVRYDKSELRRIIAASDRQAGIRLPAFIGPLNDIECDWGFRLQLRRSDAVCAASYPVAIAPGSESEADATVIGLADYEDDWWVLLESSNRGILTWSTEGGQVTRRSPRALRSILKTGPKRSGARRRLIVAQRLMLR